MSLKRKVSILFAVAAAAVVTTGAIGFACTNLATLNLSAASENRATSSR